MRWTALIAASLLTLSACTSDTGTPPEADASGPEADTDTWQAPAHAFRFGVSADLTISEAPFPADFRLGDDGTVSLPPLGDDPRLVDSAKAHILTMLDEVIATRRGFGLANPVHFFANEDIDLESAAVSAVIVSLSGPEEGRLVEARTEWSTHVQSLAVSPAWGDYIMANTTYAVLLTSGIETAAGETIAPHEDMAMLIDDAPPEDVDAAHAHASFAALRAWLATDDATVAAADIVVATVFTTEEVMPYGHAMMGLIDDFALEPPTNRYGWDTAAEAYLEAPVVEGDDLQTYFGTPTAPFHNNPGVWTSWRRERAAAQTDDGEPYSGGQFQDGIGRVINGSVMVPAPTFQTVDGLPANLPVALDGDGNPTWTLKAMIPFTLFLCDTHLEDPSNLPVAVYTHGGTSHRTAGAAFATMNCQAGVATLSYDSLFHGGRTLIGLDPSGTAVLPVSKDLINEYTGLTEGDEGFVSDYAGDPKGGPETVGQLFALPFDLNPGIAEGNLMVMATDTHAIVRYVKEGDWSGLVEGLSFDSAMVFHNGESYGTSYTTPVLALTQDFVAEFWSVGSGAMVAANLLTAPSNAVLASGFVRFTLGLTPSAEELIGAAWLDPIIGMMQWLSQRSDPLAYAPYVLRHREDDYELPIVATGDSWDHTLSAAAQMTFGKALGFPAYTHGETWTLDPTQPAGDSVDAETYATTLQSNASFGERTHTAAIFYAAQSCHAMAARPMCALDDALQYPPIVPLDAPAVSDGPGLICEIHHQSLAFLQSVLSGEPAITEPAGTCEALYGP